MVNATQGGGKERGGDVKSLLARVDSLVQKVSADFEAMERVRDERDERDERERERERREREGEREREREAEAERLLLCAKDRSTGDDQTRPPVNVEPDAEDGGAREGICGLRGSDGNEHKNVVLENEVAAQVGCWL